MMARKPADVIAKSNKPYGRDGIWAAIRKLGKRDARFTVCEVFDECGHEINITTIRDYLKSLVLAQILGQNAPSARFKSARFSLYKDHGAEAPRVNKRGEEVTQGLATEAMWRTMKTINAFTAAELALTSSTSRAIVYKTAAKSYLSFMKKAGFVREVGKSKPGTASKFVFVKSRDPGPKPPQIQRIKQVFDPNTNTVVWPIADDAKGGAK